MQHARISTRLLRACALAASCLAATGTAHGDSQVGAWEAWNRLPFFPVHVSLLPTGKVLIWPGDAGINGDDARLLDPATQNLSAVPKANYDLFCSGHAFLGDGQLLVTGGHIANNVGLARASRYDPLSNTWTAVPDMNAGRWYPTVTTLGNGDALVVSGDIDTTVGVNQMPQVYQRATNSWRNLSSAQLSQAQYPAMVLAPDGRVVEVGPSTSTRALSTSGTGAWTTIARRNLGTWRDYGSAVMYTDGKVIVMGGGDPPTPTAEVIDLNQPSPAWRTVKSMGVARRHLNATALPDGSVLVTGGTSGSGFNNMGTPVFVAERWDPATETWSTMAAATVPRLYHSAATLLPDGRVLVTGGNNQLVPEVFSPPYLFKGPRPTVTSAPSAIAWGQRFAVQTPQAGSIAKATLIRLSSVTHAFNQNQRVNTLPVTVGPGSVELLAPANGNVAPPGHYLLFLVDGNGVPSVGTVVQLGADAPSPPPAAAATLASLTPGTAVAGSGAFGLAVGGSGFLPGATVRWNGAARTTSVASSTQATAQILASDVATAGTANVTVANPDAPVSNALPFTVTAAPSGPVRHTLTVTKTGNEAGRQTITSAPAGINCGGTCSASFTAGTQVTLSIGLTGKAAFAGWSGACTGTGTCTVTMNANTTVTATFRRR